MLLEHLQKAGLGRSRVSRQAEERRTITEAWGESGLLDGIDDEFGKSSMAQLLENQMESMLKEVSQGNNTTTNVGTYDTVLFPLVRRTYARLLANEIVSVQPINLPAGLIFYLDAHVAPAPGSTFESGSIYERHYGMGGYDSSQGTATSTSGTENTTTTADITLNYSATNHTKSLASLRLYITGATEVEGFGVDNQTWAKDLFDGNQIAINLTGAPTSNQAYYLTWNEYGSLEGAYTTGASRLKMRITSTTVQAYSHKMRTEWTQEMAEDLAAYHGQNAEQYLTELLSGELAAEIDRKILRELIRVAPFMRTWDYTITNSPYSAYQTQKVHNQTLVTEMNKVSAAIQKYTLGPGANWMVVSPEIAAVIDDLENFKPSDSGPDKDQFGIGMERIGTIGSRWTVYKDSYFDTNTVLIGYKGNSFLETGYVYAPYVPFQMTPVIYDADDFVPHKGIRTRIATKVVNNKYYGKVIVAGVSAL